MAMATNNHLSDGKRIEAIKTGSTTAAVRRRADPEDPDFWGVVVGFGNYFPATTSFNPPKRLSRR
jgi:hypothetical protein